MKKKIIKLLLHLLAKFFHFSYRYQYIGLENIEKAKNSNQYKTFVISVWHQTMFSVLTSHINGPSYAILVSRSKDGDFIADTCAGFGHVSARGSSSKGGKEALIEIIKLMKLGYPAAMAVDGPRGPIYKAKPGILEMARATGSPIIPWSSYPKSAWCFNKSWDNFLIPKPFTKICIVHGEPIFIPDDISKDDFELWLTLLETKMHEGELLAKQTLLQNN